MATGEMDPKVDAHLSKSASWREELDALRAVLLGSELTEGFKWGKPCYTFDGGNVAILFRMKDYCAVGFLKGTLLNDSSGALVAPGENSQAMRQLRFTDVEAITDAEPLIKAYVDEAIGIEKAGLKVEFKKPTEFAIPEEFQTKLDERPDLKAAFEALTPGRQRAYLLYFSGAKQSKTRVSRVEKSMQQILDGKGLND